MKLSQLQRYKNKALLLDRDGVINLDKHHVHKIEDFEFIDGIFESCRYFAEHDFIIIVITNQAGIGRGLYSVEDFFKLDKWMVQQFKINQVEIAKTYHCPNHPTAGMGEYLGDSFYRKPNPGMIFKAQHDFDLNLKDSILVGDKESDIEAGVRAGVGTKVLVKSGYPIEGATKADLTIDSIKDLPSALRLL
ncbi:MAG: D-glycero-alpha-D-manno-heptose-1,7-bisphosphate 7-phosphatase [bacterium]